MCYDVAIEIRNNANLEEVSTVHVDVALLRGKIAERGMTQEKLAQAMSIDKSTLSRKMKSEALDFSVGEMHRIVEILGLSKAEAGEIFLS